MGMVRMNAVRTIVVEASTAKALKAKLPRINILPGSTGRVEIFPKAGCIPPLGPLMQLPIVGEIFANNFLPAGAQIGSRGGFGTPGPIDCNAFVEWFIPVEPPFSQTAVPMSIGPVALVAIGAALVAVMFALGWLIGRIRMVITALVESAAEALSDPKVLIGIAIIAAVLGLGAFSQRKKGSA